MTALDQRLTELEGNSRQSNRLFYLSIAPHLYDPAIKSLGASGMAREESGWRRVVIENPRSTHRAHSLINEANPISTTH